MDVECGIMDIGDMKVWEGVRDEKLPNGYNGCYLGDGHTKSPDFATAQYIYVTELHLYPFNV